MKTKYALLCVVLYGALTAMSVTEAITPRKTDIRLQGRADVVVTDGVVRLADLALIESPSIADDEAMLELRKIVVGQSPKAGETKVVQGVDILERMRDAGVRLDSLVYTFPRQVTVSRAY